MKNVVSVLALAAALCLLTPISLAVYQVGDVVADFTLNNAYGEPVSLHDFAGMAIILNFWGSG